MSEETIGEKSLIIPGNTVRNFQTRLSNIEAISLCNSMIVAEVNDLYTIDIQYNHIGEEDDEDPESHLNATRAISKLFVNVDQYVCALREVNLTGNCINEECARILCTSLAENNTIQFFSLKRNPIGNEGGMHIARMLEINTTLKKLDIGDCGLGHGSLVAIAGSLQTNDSLTSINLDNPVLKTLEEEALQHIAKMLQVNKSLNHISLCKHQITDVGAQVLAERLLDNKTLTSLHLRANKIGSFGAEALAALLLSESRVVELDLTSNRIGDDGAQAFEMVLGISDRLRKLFLGFNGIEDKGLAKLADGIGRNEHSVLEQIQVWGNDFGESCPRHFYNLLSQHTDLDIDIQPYIVDEIVYIAQKS